MQFFNSDGSLASPELSRNHRLSRSDALWMINEMDWTPESFPESEGAMARNSFVEAIARFSFKAEVNAARQRNAEAVVDPRVGTADTHGSSEAVVDLWVGTVDEDLARMEIVESATERFSSDSDSQELADVDLPESPITPGRAPPSADPVGAPDSKRRRPRSCFRHLTSPVLRQAATLAADGTFEDYEGRIFARASTVLFPSLEMIFLAVLQVGQSTLQEWLLTLTEVRQLTTCSKRWAGERPRCLSLQVLLPDSTRAPEDAGTSAPPSENILRAPFGIASLTRVASRALANQASRQGSAAAQEAASSEEPFAMVAPRHLATMEWIPSTIDPILD